MKHLVAQGESRKADKDRYYGFSLYEEDGAFFAIYHCRIYDGIKVAHKHDTDRVAMKSTEQEAAEVEAKGGRWQEFLRCYGVGVKT